MIELLIVIFILLILIQPKKRHGRSVSPEQPTRLPQSGIYLEPVGDHSTDPFQKQDEGKK